MEDLAMTLLRRSNSNYPSFPSLFDRFWEGDLMDWTNANYSNTNSTLPAVNVKENDDQYEIEVAAPGMKKDDFKVKIENDRLIISSEIKNETKDENENYSRREFSYQSFQRSFSVPSNQVDGEKIKAKYADGILHISLPKREEVKPKPAREIKII